MRRIKLLDEATSNRIAAGEVVERPASVIKELCENSLDAGATALSIAIEAGGMKRIVISDNGSGIHPQDVPLAFQRHATGKIESGDSLAAIETLGFRGEALSSIAAVSRLHMRTRQQGEEMGREIVIYGGVVVHEGECGCPEGTSIEVCDLFYNTPARLKFIKSPAPEAAAASDAVLRMILSNSDVSIKFTNNDKIVYHSPGSGLKDAIRAVYGREVVENLIDIDNHVSTVRIHGFLGKPDISRKTRAGQTILVNGRYIRDNMLSDAIREGYGQKLMIGKHPFFVLNVDLPHALVDVNVHPQKMEVRISNKESISELLRQAVNEAIVGVADIRHMESKQATVKEDIHQVRFVDYQTNENISESESASAEQALSELQPMQLEQSMEAMKKEMGVLYMVDSADADNISEPSGLLAAKYGYNMDEPEEEPIKDLSQQPMRLIGQAFRTFAIVESGELLYYIDQHAAHERLTYNRYKEQAERQQVASQQLLTPTIVELTFAEMSVYKEHSSRFDTLGFEIDIFGATDIAVRAVPMILGEPTVETMIHDILDELSINKVSSLADMVDDAIIMSSCKHSVKAGDLLDESELQVLVNMLAKNKDLTCPHGRPVAIYITKKDLEKGFKRLV